MKVLKTCIIWFIRIYTNNKSFVEIRSILRWKLLIKHINEARKWIAFVIFLFNLSLSYSLKYYLFFVKVLSSRYYSKSSISTHRKISSYLIKKKKKVICVIFKNIEITLESLIKIFVISTIVEYFMIFDLQIMLYQKYIIYIM